MEYLDFLPGIEGEEGEEGVPMDLNVSVSFLVVVVAVAVSGMLAIREAESKRRTRRMSSSISFWARRRASNFSALALFQRENRTSMGGRWCDGFGGGAEIGKGMANFSAIDFV